MGKLIYLMGKSSTGKDTIYKHLLESDSFQLKRIVPYTTRPIRAGEEQGGEYYFTDEDGYRVLEAQGMVVEARSYHTFHGMWRYFTVDDGKIELGADSYIIIGTLESYFQTASFFGYGKVLPVLIEVDDGVRLQRALNRERKQKEPKYQEMCRRFLADDEDFAEEKMKPIGMKQRFINEELNKCLIQITDYIKENMD